MFRFGQKKNNDTAEVIDHLQEEENKSKRALQEEYALLCDELEEKKEKLKKAYNDAVANHNDEEFIVELCSDTLMYTVVQTSISYPDFVLSLNMRQYDGWGSIETKLDIVKRYISYVEDTELSVISNGKYGEFWNEDEAVSHLSIVQKNHEEWKKRNSNGND